MTETRSRTVLTWVTGVIDASVVGALAASRVAIACRHQNRNVRSRQGREGSEPEHIPASGAARGARGVRRGACGVAMCRAGRAAAGRAARGARGAGARTKRGVSAGSPKRANDRGARWPRSRARASPLAAAHEHRHVARSKGVRGAGGAPRGAARGARGTAGRP